ncbi:methylenetetrahydrofolate reductase [uncultured Veillonella sp.]|uniref:methylenetetrahydrofolate reductase n=1 Tax=uncultured Veillonella sp. TaxID=159268 RepID=UPI0027DE544A|nr:methylenetetrahydrofolate reductase [uncultured Veillonella sp.]
MVTSLREKHQAGQFTITVELDPPKSASVNKTFKEAAQLLDKVDAINIADCPMAKLRMSPIALAHLIKFRAQIDTIFHLTCRDRNILGLQAELLGAAALGVNNILTLTGDEPSRDDHPDAKPVFEVDSIGLLKIANTLNNGFDLAGNPLDESTNFYIGTTGNPGADDLDAEKAKIIRKIEAGANFIQTQPIYDLEKAKRFVDMVEPLGLPVMLGLIPLKSFKMATYLHTKVPGISLTDDILNRMEKGGKEAGLEIALETLLAIKQIAHGVHIMPLNDIQTVLYLIDHIS